MSDPGPHRSPIVPDDRSDGPDAQTRGDPTIDRTHEFMKLVEYSTDVISIVDGNGVFQFMTPSAERILGYEPADLVGEIGFEYVHPDDRAEAAELFASTANSPGQRARIEFRFDHPDGWIWIESRARNMLNDPDIGGIVIYSRDVTERKQREQRLQVFNRVLRHNLRNDLNVIRGSIENAIDDAQNGGKELESALETTADLLATAEVSRTIQRALEDPSLAEQDLPETVDAVVSRAREAYPDIDIQVTTPPILAVTAAEALADALWELLQNACEHGEGPVEILVTDEEDQAEIEIVDAGPGIPDYELTVIERREESALEHASGLGLWFAHWVIESSGGELEFETDEQTTVRVTLPANQS